VGPDSSVAAAAAAAVTICIFFANDEVVNVYNVASLLFILFGPRCNLFRIRGLCGHAQHNRIPESTSL
jgi:hypothetical protein